ncbi:hypothetical protein RY831_16395 [Noviherbaspirillum sp. CPCC 100848]|uniref:Uncharacterized protein n=1 Tax=Noviherbaspirillum album TaxID=3080276 RepID=A0ABU6JBP9_9BURK|nr:hypothetical protein [Noviherbaspirillum sp. CPCC 100848]MEC4720745.1 hypothetical protein [Noviherbaspirillum sp. CPCC 100848]
MDINKLSTAGPMTPSFDSFVEAAGKGAGILVSQDGRQLDILAEGKSPMSGRQVSWVQGSETDSTSIFLHALSQRYSSSIANAIAKELGLGPAPGKPLASRLVEQSAEMARMAGVAMEGVDFLNGLLKK